VRPTLATALPGTTVYQHCAPRSGNAGEARHHLALSTSPTVLSPADSASLPPASVAVTGAARADDEKLASWASARRPALVRLRRVEALGSSVVSALVVYP